MKCFPSISFHFLKLQVIVKKTSILTLLKTKSAGHATVRGPDSSQMMYCKQSKG